MKKYAVLLLSLAITACASTPKNNPAPAAAAAPASTASTESAETAAAKEAQVKAAEMVAQETAAAVKLEKHSVYFDFDKSNVKKQFQNDIQQEADFLKANKNDVVTLEGNCDDRGSSEYNLGLGSERAKAVQKDLELLGVPADQLKVVSYGEEKPRLNCEAERCWKENRRVDFEHKIN